MAINIIRQGAILPELYFQTCPNCKLEHVRYNLEEPEDDYPICTTSPKPPLIPTFRCPECGCVWQWFADSGEATKDQKGVNNE